MGLTLVEDRGKLLYSEFADEAAAQQFYNADINYSRIPPEKEIVLTGGDHRGGFGLEYAGQNTTRYHVGTSIDARFPNELRLGPLPTTVTTLVSQPTIVNANKETAATGWEGGAQSSAQHKTGENSWAVSDTGVKTVESYQDITPFYPGAEYVYTEWVMPGEDGLTCYCVIDDGISETASTGYGWPGSLTWNHETATRTLNVGATRLRLILRTVSTEASAWASYFDDSAVTLNDTTKGAYATQVDFNSKHYVSSGRFLFVQDGGGTSYTSVLYTAANITDLAVGTVGGADYLFVCIGWSNPYLYSSTGTAFTTSTAATKNIKFMSVVGTQFYGADTNSTVQSTVNPLNAGTAWANSKQIGEDRYDTVDLVQYENLLYVKKSDNTVYYMSSNTPASQVVTTLISGKSNLGGTNTYRMFVWRDSALIIPYGKQGLLHYDGSTITHINPALYMNNAAAFSGQIQGVAGDDQKLYVILNNSTKGEILSGHQETVDGATDWRWHPIASIAMSDRSSLAISGHVNQRLWAGSTIGTEALYYVPITVKYGDIGSDTDITYQTLGSLETPFYHFNLMGDTKAFIKLTLRMSGTTSAIYWRAYYKLLGGSWVEIQTATAYKTSPSTSNFIFAAVGTSVTSTMIQFKFEGITNNTAVSPVLIGWDARAIWYPAERKLISCVVRVEDMQPTVNMGNDDVLGSTIKSTLDGINSLNWPRAFYPPYWLTSADTIYVKKLALPGGRPQLTLRKLEKDQNPIWVYELLLEKITMS